MAALPALSALGRPFEFRDPDGFWHLASGRWIWEHRAIPRVDPFAYPEGRPWVDHEWLFQAGARLVQEAAGAPGLFALRCAGYTLAWGLPLAWVLRGREAPARAAIAAGGLAMTAGLPFSELRPLLVSAPLLAAAVWGCRRAAAGRRDALILMPAMFALWANLHATFTLGLLAVACFVVAPAGLKGADALPVSPADSAPLRRRFAMLLAACAAVTLLNPYGWNVWAVGPKVAGTALFLANNQEWRPPDLSVEFLPFYPLLGAVAVGAASTAAAGGWCGLLAGEWMLAVALGVAACLSRRIIPYFAVVAAAGPAALGIRAVAGWVARCLPSCRWRSRVAASLTVVAAVAAAAFASECGRPLTPFLPRVDGLPHASGSYPDRCAEALKSFAPTGHVACDYNHGGYLHYAVGPAWKVGMDGRNELHGEAVTRRYEELMIARGDWTGALDRDGVDAALVSFDICAHRPNLAVALGGRPETWAVAGFDDAAILFVRRAKAPAGWLATRELRAVRPWMLYEEQADDLAHRAMLKPAVAELARLTADGPHRLAGHMLAQALADTGDGPGALAALAETDRVFGRDERSVELSETVVPRAARPAAATVNPKEPRR